jgi:hypothetical protein
VVNRVDPARTSVAGGLPGWSEGGSLVGKTPTMLETYVPWKQGRGSGSARVTIFDKSVVNVPRYAALDNRSDRCVRATRRTAPAEPAYSSCAFRTVGGKRVLVGVVSSAPTAYFASYVRPTVTWWS